MKIKMKESCDLSKLQFNQHNYIILRLHRFITFASSYIYDDYVGTKVLQNALKVRYMYVL